MHFTGCKCKQGSNWVLCSVVIYKLPHHVLFPVYVSASNFSRSVCSRELPLGSHLPSMLVEDQTEWQEGIQSLSCVAFLLLYLLVHVQLGCTGGQCKYTELVHLRWPDTDSRLTHLVHAFLMEGKCYTALFRWKIDSPGLEIGFLVGKTEAGIELCGPLLEFVGLASITSVVSWAKLYLCTLAHDWVGIPDKYQLVLSRFAGEQPVDSQLLMPHTFYVVWVTHL